MAFEQNDRNQDPSATDYPRDDLRMERSRLATFWQCTWVPLSGVWVVQLAGAGFYCPDKDSPVIRCVFCHVEVAIGEFRHRPVREVHRDLSPSCSLLTGEARNQSVHEQNLRGNLEYIQAWFGPGTGVDPQDHQGEPAPRTDGGGTTELRGAAVPPDHLSWTHLNSSGPSPSKSPHVLASAVTSVSHPSRTERGREAAGSSEGPSSTVNTSGAQAFATPRSALSQSTQTGTGSTTGDSSSPRRTNGHPGQRISGQGQGTEPPRQPGPRTSELARAQNATNAGAPVNAGNPQTYQTARPEERSQERTEPGGGPAGSDPSSQSASTNESVRQVVTYAQLGIYTQEPKRPDLATVGSRVRTYSNWPHEATHSPQEMAEAGFYFVGVDDLVRCFYCKGGLKSWSRSLRPWVEHAHFYPHCPFVGQVKGQEFIDVVQELKERPEEVSDASVEEELRKRQSNVSGKGKETTMPGTAQGAPGALALGGMEADVQEGDDADEQAIDARLRKASEELENDNQEITNQRICKICQMEDVSILFLPCGHLVSCSQCAPALRTCAVCRQRVKGRVRVLDDKRCMDAGSTHQSTTMTDTW